ncbi:hypothetical protein GTR00_14585, partial [Kineococcus sp. T90]
VPGPAAATAPDPGAAAGAEPAAAEPAAAEEFWSSAALSAELDERLAEVALGGAGVDTGRLSAELEAAGTGAAGAGPVAALDGARQRLAQQLAEAEPGRAPVSEMEEFIPVVMAAMKVVKLGVRVIGRKRVVDLLAGLLATLVQGMVGPQAARQLSRHVADAGLRLLGLEAERGPGALLGTEALVATTEDTLREVLALPPASLGNELLLEAAVQQAFTAAAVRHVPAAALRADLAEAETDGEQGIWVMFPRNASAPRYRYKKFSVVEPLTLTRPRARAVVFAEGETLEDRLLDAGVRSWPVRAEASFYEFLPGAGYGHLAAFEAEGEEGYSRTALEFSEVAATAVPSPTAPPSTDAAGPGPRPVPARSSRPGARAVRIQVPGLPLPARRPFTLRLREEGGRPHLRLDLHLSERRADRIAGHLRARRPVDVVAELRGVLGGPLRPAVGARLQEVLTRRGLGGAGSGRRLADLVAESALRAVAQQLPTAAAAFTSAAQDPAPGMTLTFTWTFAGRGALARGQAGDPGLAVHAGVHRG